MKLNSPNQYDLELAEAEFSRLAQETTAINEKIQRVESGESRRDFLLGRAAREQAATDAKCQHLVTQIFTPSH